MRDRTIRKCRAVEKEIQDTGANVVLTCIKHDVSLPTFYKWRKEQPELSVKPKQEQSK